jgi:uncharacterized protein (TIGR03382 family)
VTAYSDSTATIVLPPLFTGPYLLSVTVNGITGGRIVDVVGNDWPIAEGASLDSVRGAPVSFVLGASDPEDDPLTYSVVTLPAHGTLTGTAPALVYTPEAGFSGTDALRFQASDGQSTSNVAVVSFHVSASNRAPVASDRNLFGAAGGTVQANLVAVDPDGDPVGFTVVTGPAHGTLSGEAPALVYTPAQGFTGTDRFTFQANDGTQDSNVATVTISIADALTPAPPPPPQASGCDASGSGGGAGVALLALGLFAFVNRRRSVE